MTIQDIFGLYDLTQPTRWKIIGSRKEKSDFRHAIRAEWPDRTLIIKIAANTFTTPERVAGWSTLSGEYCSLGYYCPQFVANKAGNLSETVPYKEKSCVVWAEEPARYQTADQSDQKLIRNGEAYVFHNDVMRSIGVVASKHFDFATWPSGYSIIHPFAPSDPCDEAMDCAVRFKDLVLSSLPSFSARFRSIWSLFEDNKRKLETVYDRLPCSVFQADLNPTNILVDGSGRFVGLIDFNLSGRDTALNYMFMTSMWDFGEDAGFYAKDGQKRYYDAALDKKFDDSLLHNLKIAGQTYSFSQLEKETAILLYRYVRPFRWPQIDELKEARDDSERVSKLLDWVEYELTREDLGFESALK